MIDHKGATYEGDFAVDLANGYGNKTYTFGHNYQGEWQNGMKHGFGKLTYQ